jgi:hypothetical protein
MAIGFPEVGETNITSKLCPASANEIGNYEHPRNYGSGNYIYHYHYRSLMLIPLFMVGMPYISKKIKSRISRVI